MPGIDNDVRINIPVLDRLIDREPEVSEEPIASRAKNLRELRLAVRRDLEWLLNTHEFIQKIQPDLTEVKHSLATYGLPDITTSNPDNPASQAHLCNIIAAKIRLFEPRLSEVAIRPAAGQEKERSLHLWIEAQLHVDPAPEPITFDTLLDRDTGHFAIKGN